MHARIGQTSSDFRAKPRSQHAARAACVAVGGVCFALGIALIDPPHTSAQRRRNDAPPARTTPASTEEQRARERFAEGSAAYDTGDYETALTAFGDAYALSGRPRLLHNMYLCAERLGRAAEAARLLRRYLDEEDAIDNRESLIARLARLDERAAREGSTGTTPAARSPEDASENASDTHGPGAGPWVLVSAGAASAIAGGVLVGLAMADVARIEDPDAGTRWSEVAGAWDRTVPMSGAGFALLGVGVAAAGAGIVWLATSGDAESPPTQASAALGVTPTGLVVRGRF